MLTREVKSEASASGGGPVDRLDLCAVVALAGLVASVYREHLTRHALSLGNFDRLSAFLNTLHFQVQGWRTGTFGAWDDSMFMGRNAFALPGTFPNAFNWLVSLCPTGSFYWVAGDISIGLLVLTGWTAYLFIRSVVASRFAAFVGAALYQFSALAVLKVSQNDMSFAVITQIPLLLWLVRGLRPDRWGARFAALCLVLTHLLYFCFLQKVAYALLLVGAYTIYRSAAIRSRRVLAVVIAAGFVAFVAAFPRIYGIFQELGELTRKVSPNFDMHDFDALYRWQNFRPVDVWRWFNDGLFGRFYGETMSLRNNLNVTEGTLMFTGGCVPFLLLAGIIRWNHRWFGLIRRGQGEYLFCYGGLLVVFGVILSKTFYHLLFLLFLRMDFTHTRIVIAGLPLSCALIAAYLAQLRPREGMAPARHWCAAFAALPAAFALQWGLSTWAHAAAAPQPLALTLSPLDLWHLVAGQLQRMVRIKPEDHPLSAAPIVTMLPSAFSEIFATGLIVAGLLAGWACARHRLFLRTTIYCAIGWLLVLGSWRFANFQVNDSHLRTARPFSENNSYIAGADEFRVPSPAQFNRLHRQIDTPDFRVVFFDVLAALPSVASPHLGAMWELRQIDGYNSGVPARLAALPWPAGTLGLRSITLGGLQAGQLPWSLLAFLNVKYAVRPSTNFYKNAVSTAELANGWLPQHDILMNPLHVAPRVFFPKNVHVVTTLSGAVAVIHPAGSPAGTLIDPTIETVVESPVLLPQFAAAGTIRGHYSGDRIALDLSPANEARLLVLDELYHPQWRAWANGQELKILPANVVMRGVIVPPHVEHVTMVFDPFCDLHHAIAALSIALLLAVAAAIAMDRRWRPC